MSLPHGRLRWSSDARLTRAPRVEVKSSNWRPSVPFFISGVTPGAPETDGSHIKWKEFWDSFSSSVDNNA